MSNDFEFISLIYKVDEEYKIERVRGVKSGDFYQIKEVPIFSSNIAMDDLVSVDREGEHLFFEKVIKPSGHSVVHVAILNSNVSAEILAGLRSYEITIYGVKGNIYLALDIPPEVSYRIIKKYLDKQMQFGNLEYQEASISAQHNYLGNFLSN
jgi:hypothetical protein